MTQTFGRYDLHYSGNGSLAQRLLGSPKEQEAVLYEVIARGTVEERAARARRVKDQ